MIQLNQKLQTQCPTAGWRSMACIEQEAEGGGDDDDYIGPFLSPNQ